MPSAPSSSRESRNRSLPASILLRNILCPMFLAFLVYNPIRPEIEQYDVFLSFRGADIRYSFLRHLRSALLQKSIKVFIDEEIIRGDPIMPRLYDAIDISKVAVVIFSKNYALSENNLNELTRILEYHAPKTTCIPVFYGVNPSDVMNQFGDFEQAFVAQKEKFKLQNKVFLWKHALNALASLKGLDSSVTKSDVELIKELIKVISLKLERIPAKYQPRSWWLPCFLLVLLIFVSMAVTYHFSRQQQAGAHKYDVFVNYYGEITLFRKLVDALDKAGITSFNDHEQEGGEHMKKTIETAIEESKVAVIIFSAGYAYSAYCLDELVKILDCHKSQGLALVPVYYQIDVHDVKQPERFFREALAVHRERRGGRNVQRWWIAIEEVASLRGLISQPRHDRNTAATGPTRSRPLHREKGKNDLSIIPEIVAAVREKLKNNSWAGVQKDPVSYTYRLCLTVCSFLVSLLVLILSDEMTTQSLMGGEIIRKTQRMPL